MDSQPNSPKPSWHNPMHSFKPIRVLHFAFTFLSMWNRHNKFIAFENTILIAFIKDKSLSITITITLGVHQLSWKDPSPLPLPSPPFFSLHPFPSIPLKLSHSYFLFSFFSSFEPQTPSSHTFLSPSPLHFPFKSPFDFVVTHKGEHFKKNSFFS